MVQKLYNRKIPFLPKDNRNTVSDISPENILTTYPS